MIAWLLLCAAAIGFLRRVDLFDAFSGGAEEGMKSAVRIVPCLAATLTALRVLESSGLAESLGQALAPFAEALGLPPGSAPMLLLRPLSGSASLALWRRCSSSGLRLLCLPPLAARSSRPCSPVSSPAFPRCW